ncbi:MAG: rod-binding protein [Treponema sp.]|jgi:flagellar protein FlgJ|nr:rod-binding protein [Treponema sp.]
MIDIAAGVSALDTAYVPFAERNGIPAGEETGFLETLERARQKAEASEQTPPARPAVPPGRLDKTLPGFDQKLYEQCEALEGFLIRNMLKGMRGTVMKSNLIDTGFAGEIYEDMLWDEYAGAYAQKADFGLAEMAYMELTGRRGRLPL